MRLRGIGLGLKDVGLGFRDAGPGVVVGRRGGHRAVFFGEGLGGGSTIRHRRPRVIVNGRRLGGLLVVDEEFGTGRVWSLLAGAGCIQFSCLLAGAGRGIRLAHVSPLVRGEGSEVRGERAGRSSLTRDER
jgi:hypothetical protein